ncbi:M48 family metalloprotease [Frankia sp. AgB1.9]|uniref:M48 family metalloprotease n=1 Tax=unclassified Frankia TaxID=2632575 RepID=UPI001931910D|nr:MULTISPECIES: M48 family metalloprotease [unclassified Frankia]MBL7489942.1 M48 family metalloprotease [Frankia sp. AgW1.1]MBL7552673.1 M48 family metalloprotease [Frankia sp. AgB1.9]MBL7623838.1 M48 family metalloprotease [Frankia sp. AgB1.8]
MYVSVYLLFALVAAIAVTAPRLGRHLHPRAATRTLTALAVGAAAATGWALGLLATAGLARIDEITAHTGVPPAADPVPRTVGLLAASALAVLTIRALRATAARRRARRAFTGLHDTPAAGDLVVVADHTPYAHALPGYRTHPGRVIVSDSMLRALDPAEQRVLLAHERAHLHSYHHRYRAAADLAATVNPLLRATRAAIVFQTERWADEQAATEIGDRQTAARSLARAALAATDTAPAPAPATLGYLHHGVVARVHALQAPPTRNRWHRAAPTLLTAALTAAVLSDATIGWHRVIAQLHP